MTSWWKVTEETACRAIGHAMDRLVTDALVEILQCLPPGSRGCARLVCRRWRDVVDTRVTERQISSKLLIWNVDRGIAYVADDMSSSSTGSCTQLWRTSDTTSYYISLQLVGTCNGILCFCDNNYTTGGAITLLNPATGETLPVPLLPYNPRCVEFHVNKKWGDAYSFAYRPSTGEFKIVHVPCSYGWVGEFTAIQVLTLGEATWREVSAGPGSVVCKLDSSIVSIKGMTYWVSITAGDRAKIVTFDLMEERVIANSMPLPARHDRCRLTEVHGRLGYVVIPNVWVLEEGQRWSHRYNFEQRIPRQHFVYGEYVLTCKGLSFYGHQTKATSTCDREVMCNKVVQISQHDEGRLVAMLTRAPERQFDDTYETFAYVETKEPLSIYLSESLKYVRRRL